MFFGALANWAEQQSVLPPAVVKAVEAVRQQDISQLAAGRYELEGDQAFFLVQDVTTKILADTRSEAHHLYADVQLVISGRERFGVALSNPGLPPLEDRMKEGDIAFYPSPSNESFIDLDPGMFAVFYPEELHRPCCAVDKPSAVRKVVIKLHRAQLGL
jgi:biofilm protein TabA